MKKQKMGCVLLAGALAASVFLAGCGGGASSAASGTSAAQSAPAASSTASAEAAAGTITLTDMKDRTATLEGPATKVVALSAADCEIVYALGAGDVLVGRGEYCDYPEEVLSVPMVQSGSELNVEKVIELGPQVVLMNTMNQTVEQVQQMEGAGITVLASEATDIEGVYKAIQMIGTALGKDAEAEKLVGDMQKSFADIKAGAAEGEKTVYFEVSPLEYGLWTAGGGTFMEEIANMAGLANAFADVEGWSEISEEQVLQRDPDYIITVGMSFGDGPNPVEEILGRPGWQGLTAVQEGRVFSLNQDELTRPGPRLVNAAKALQEYVKGGSAPSAASQSTAASSSVAPAVAA